MLEGIFELDLFGDGDAVMGDGGRAPLFVNGHVPASRAKRDFHGLRQGIDDGKIRALAVSSPARSPLLPDVPTAQEAGVAGFEVLTWNGLYAPAGTPKEAVALLEREVQAILAEPDVVKRFLDLSVQARPTSAEALGQRMASEIDRWTKVIHDAGIERR